MKGHFCKHFVLFKGALRAKSVKKVLFIPRSVLCQNAFGYISLVVLQIQAAVEEKLTH